MILIKYQIEYQKKWFYHDIKTFTSDVKTPWLKKKKTFIRLKRFLPVLTLFDWFNTKPSLI